MPCVSSMSLAHLACLSTESTLRPITFTPRLSNSDLSRATDPSSVVHTGVKSLGCENSRPQELLSQLWKLIGPCVVSVVKSGAGEPMVSDMGCASLVRYEPCAHHEPSA